MKNKKNNKQDFQTRAVFLTGMTDYGNELLTFHPKIQIGETLKHDLCLKSMPMACEDGDMLITHISDYQAICLTRIIPCFEKQSFKKDTHATLGLLIPKGINPLPFYNFLEKLMNDLKNKGSLTRDTLEAMVPLIYNKLNKKIA